ncbi:hypothetical protein, partial [Salmonella sp. gx-f7]|uniref:hypothetical protein n=1 Tax=Salmonella sp. gx-f7 TaxID=2582606 RepID=UPI001F3BB805
MSLLSFSAREKHFESMLSFRLLLSNRSTQKQVFKPEMCDLMNSTLPGQFHVVAISSWSENSKMSLLSFSAREKHFESM